MIHHSTHCRFDMPRSPGQIQSADEIVNGFEQEKYLLDEDLATILYISLRLEKPVLLEGNPGVGKTDIANHLASFLDTDLIRLQCYEGLDVHSAVYEWNYQKQLLSIKLLEKEEGKLDDKETHIFSEQFLLERPLLQSIRKKDRAPVLLIDEVDRSDEEFEAFLLELLSAFQISIPEMGTLKAVHKPIVVLTSNRTRELSDALKRRCLYHWVDFPSFEKELQIVLTKLPDVREELARQMIQFVQDVRKLPLQKQPGIAESLDWAEALSLLGVLNLDEDTVERSIGCLIKSQRDQDKVKEAIPSMLA